jgi:hypothetical protein
MYNIILNDYKMNTLRLTPDNVFHYMNHQIIFKHRNNYIVKQIISISDTGKSIKIDLPYLKNNLEIVSRKVYVILK